MFQNYISSILVLYILQCNAAYSPVVEVQQGKLRGSIKVDWKGGKFYTFLRVPYAEKPVGKLRFMIPSPPEKWDGMLDAIEDMPQCLQLDLATHEIIGQEDCLYLNVHTPEIITKNLRPVMVFIHGGSFIIGSGRYDMHGPEFLMPEDVVLVTINYRLGLFGFLNFGDPKTEVFGNMGLKDQNLALHWVQRNINKFGGDPNSVTIFGASAGGACAHMHMLSPMSQGLFHKVILQSGTALAFFNANGQRNSGALVANSLGFKGNSGSEMLSFLQKLPAETLFNISRNIPFMLSVHKSPIAGPIVEISNKDPFLPEKPEVLISENKFANVPFMLGTLDFDGLTFYTLALLSSWRTEVTLEEAIPHVLNIKDGIAKMKTLKLITRFYEDNVDAMTKYRILGDIWFVYNVYKSAWAHGKSLRSNMYLYLISAATKLNIYKRLHPALEEVTGANHGDELGYLFKTKFTPDIKPESVEAKVMQRIVKLWTNFAKYGDPTPTNNSLGITWTPVREEVLNVLEIGTKNMEMRINPYADLIAFWDTILGKTTESDVHTEL